MPQEIFGVLFFLGGVIGFALACWGLCYYVDREKSFVARRCRKKEIQYSREEEKYYRDRKNLGKMVNHHKVKWFGVLLFLGFCGV